MKLKDLIEYVPEIANFTSNIYVLRLPCLSNIIKVNNELYELRIFSFKLVGDTETTFGDFVRKNNLEDSELISYNQIHLIKPLSFSINTPEVYCNIALLKLFE